MTYALQAQDPLTHNWDKAGRIKTQNEIYKV